MTYVGGSVASYTENGLGAYDGTSTGQGTYYLTDGVIEGATGSVNRPSMVQVIERPDGSIVYTYANAGGQILLTDLWNGASGDGQQDWITAYEYDAYGRLTRVAEPSATGVSPTTMGSLDFFGDTGREVYYYVSDNGGLVNVTDYYDTGDSGGPANYVKDVAVEQGANASSKVIQAAYTYTSHVTGGVTSTYVASVSTYPTAGGAARTTSTSYTFSSGVIGPASITTTLPAVSTTNNGTGTSDSTVTLYDDLGRVAWTKDQKGYITGYSYDDPTSAIVQVWRDATGTTVATGTGWTPHSTGLNLKTTTIVDAEGRPVMVTSPRFQGLSNDNTFVTYYTYDDGRHEVRTFSGWNLGSQAATGIAPITIVRQDWAHGYDETLTTSMAPTTNSMTGMPSGNQSISDVQALTRTRYNIAGQAVESDNYFNLGTLSYTTNVTIGTVGTNYYATTYEYDALGLNNKTTLPTGTIYATTYDMLGREVADSVGTSSANMVTTAVYQYDGGGVGDSNLTEMVTYTSYTSNVADRSLARATAYAYDWRDRQVWEKDGALLSLATNAATFDLDPTREVNAANTNWYDQQGIHRPITISAYDNLDELTEVKTYDGDTVSYGTTPGTTSLTGRMTTAYDELGRAYSSSVYSVDPTTGAVGTNALTASTWFDGRGLIVKSIQPNGPGMMYAYDGAGRETDAYAVLPSDVTGTLGLAGSTVVQQADWSYDADGNVLVVATRQRFDDASGTGPLAGANGTGTYLGTTSTYAGPTARVSYAQHLYDNLDREIMEVDVGAIGTNTFTPYASATSVPLGSATVLVTRYSYDAAGQTRDVTSPNGNVTRTLYDMLGRATDTYQNYVSGTSNGSTSVRTGYAYDGDGHVVLMTAYVPGGVNQQTAFVYGVGTNTGSGVFSNDLLRLTEYASPSTGAPSTASAQQEAYSYDVAGEQADSTDRNGTFHAYTYDSLGRLSADRVTTAGTGISSGTSAATYAYDKAGRLATAKTFSNTLLDHLVGNTYVLTRVDRTYDGFGNLALEKQPGGTVAYTYSDGSGNASRLTGMSYGQESVSYVYDGGVDTAISRVSEIDGMAVDGSGTTALETYTYLGLDQAVTRGRPEEGSGLSYVSVGATGDAGDKYVGLDRFGRIADQNWTDGSTSADRLEYTYDADGNVTSIKNVLSAANGQYYTYDGMDRLTSFARGTLTFSGSTPTGIAGTPSQSEAWDLSATGNWGTFTFGGTAHSRGYDAQNRLTTISASGSVTYDDGGEETVDEDGNRLQYDGWGHLVKWDVPTMEEGPDTAAFYRYDALGRKISEATGGTSGTVTAYAYSASGQTLMETTGPANLSATSYTVGEQDDVYAAHAGAYVDEMAWRDDFTTTVGGVESRQQSEGAEGISIDDDTVWDGRAYVRQAANFDVTSTEYLTSDGSTTTKTTERYELDPYGANEVVLNGDFAPKSGGTGWNWHVLHQGLSYDGNTGLYYNRARWYDAAQGQFVTADPSGWPDGPNGYAAVGDDPTVTVDPRGLQNVGGGGAGFAGEYGVNDLVYMYDESGEDVGWGDGIARPGDADVGAEEYGLVSDILTGAVWGASDLPSLVQGVMNAANGLQDVVVGSINRPFAGTVVGSPLVAMRVLPDVDLGIPSPDWSSTHALVDEDPSWHSWSKGLGGLGLSLLVPALADGLFGYALGRGGFFAEAAAADSAAAIEMLDPAEMRFSQTSAGGNGRADILRKSMAGQGWAGDPVDAVRTPDGVTALDNTRVAVAKEVGIGKIPVRVHTLDEPLPPDMLNRRWNAVGDTAKTWGEALKLRTGSQKPPLSATGTATSPRLPKPKI